MKFNIFPYLSALFYIINTLIIINLIFNKREKPEKVLGWLLVLMLLPPFGLILYLYMGINWQKNHLNERMTPEMANQIHQSLSEIKGEYESLATLVSNANSTPVFTNNEIKLYRDGVEKFEDLITDIKNAKHHIHLEYYIFRSDELGRRICEACKERAQNGVKVRLVMDKIGGRTFSKEYKKELKEAGVQIVTFTATFAFVSRYLDMSLNYRDHRKIAIIDGTIGYIGGLNIGDEYVGKSKYGYWRDTHMRVRGDFVMGLQALYFNDFFSVLKRNVDAHRWEYVKRSERYDTEQNLEAYFKKTNLKNNLAIQLAYSGPQSPVYSIELMMIKMIGVAKERIFISSPYFTPSEAAMNALKNAILAGVDVRIMFPAQYDHPVVGHASMTYLGELVELGARVFLYDKEAFAHNKAVVVDGKLFTVGTANFDIRSFALNYEVNALVYDEYYASKMEGFFYEDMEKSTELTLEVYQKRPQSVFLKERFFRIFSLLM